MTDNVPPAQGLAWRGMVSPVAFSSAMCGVRVAALDRPIMDAGGDFYEITDLHDGRVTILVGDVAGHGPAAAWLMTRVKHEASWLAQSGASPGAILEHLNAWLDARDTPERFVCMACVQIDTHLGEAVVANAGQLPPLVRRACGRIVALAAVSGPPVGVLAGERYAETRFRFDSGDRLLLVTDGITDCLAEASDPLGEDALARLLGQSGGDIASVCDAVFRGASGHGLRDDTTVLAVEMAA